MNSFDLENHMLWRKGMANRAAAAYPHNSHLRSGRAGLAYRRLLAGIGSQLVALGYRLQGELDQLAAAPDLADSLGLQRNEPCLEC